MRFLLTFALGFGLLVAVGALAFGCYKGTPICRPGTVDYPQCGDPTQPSGPFRFSRAADGGATDAGHRLPE